MGERASADNAAEPRPLSMSTPPRERDIKEAADIAADIWPAAAETPLANATLRISLSFGRRLAIFKISG